MSGLFYLGPPNDTQSNLSSLVSSKKGPHFGGALEKLSPSGSVVPELGDIRRQINFLEDTAYYMRDDFNYISRIVDGLKFTKRDLQRTLKCLEKDLARREAELVALRDDQVNFEYHIECLTNIARSIEQMTVLEAKHECLCKTVEEQTSVLMQDFM